MDFLTEEEYKEGDGTSRAPKKKKAKLSQSSRGKVGSKSPSDSTHDNCESAAVREIKPTSNGNRKSSMRTGRNGASKEVWSGAPNDELEGGWPEGWLKETRERTRGTCKRQTDSYWYSPIEKKMFRSLNEVRCFLRALNMFNGDEAKAWKEFKGKRKNK